LNVSGTTLNGIKSGVNISTYDTLHIPREITKINPSAFDQQTSLTILSANINKLDFGNESHLSAIGREAFYLCNKFTNELILPATLTTISENSFAFCSGFTKIDLSLTKLTSLATYSFGGCAGVKTIIFNNNIQSIGDKAFQDINSFEGTLTLPAQLKTIGSSAFSSLGFGKSINIQLPSNLQTIGSSAFNTIAFANNTLTIPDALTTIGNLAFNGCRNLTTLVLGKKCNDIRTAAFEGARSLVTIIINYDMDIVAYQNSASSGWLYDTNFEIGKTSNVEIYVPNNTLLNKYTQDAN
jgi:hypothetical protein